jgi:hypothetical protein
MIKIFMGAVIFSTLSIVLFFEKSLGLSILIFTVPIALFIINIIEKKKNT